MGGAAVWAARRTGDARRALGLVAPRSWPRAVGLALVTVIVALIVSARWSRSSTAPTRRASSRTRRAHPAPGPWPACVLAYVAVAVAGPLVEELIFRGLLTAAFRRRFGPWRTALLTAAFFAAAHFIPRVMPAGLPARARARVRVRAGRQHRCPGILVHCVYNGIALTAAVTKH